MWKAVAKSSLNASNRHHSHTAKRSRRRFIRTTAGGIIFAASAPMTLQGCSPIAAIPDSATAAWRHEPKEDDIRLWALSHAILAPNPHNLQPWMVDLKTHNQIDVSIDPERILPETDQFGRQITIGTGAMLGLLELAAATKNYVTRVSWLDNEPNKLLRTGSAIIRVQFEESNSAQDNTNKLFKQIRRRHTVRQNYDPGRIPDRHFETELSALTADNQSVGVLRKPDNKAEFMQIAKLVTDAWEIEMSTPATMMESMRLLRVGSDEIEKHRDGITIDDPFVVALSKLGLMNRNETLSPESRAFKQQIERFNQSIDSTTGWFWLSTDGNSRENQLSAGRTYVLAQLLATQMGMVMHPVSQGLQEYKEMEPVYEQLQRKFGQPRDHPEQTLQMLSRVGYLPTNADKPSPSPRRGLDAHIVS